MNSVIVTGYLAEKPDLRNLTEDRQVANMRLAITNGGQHKPTWIDVSVFGASAPTCHQVLDKGSRVAVNGRLEEDKWTDKDGNACSKHRIVGFVEFLDPPPNKS